MSIRDLGFKGLRGVLERDKPIGPITWLRVGGTAELFFMPVDEEDLAVFLQQLPQDVPLTILGLGSNLLVRDGGIAGAVVRLSPRGFGQVENIGGNRLKAGAALPDRKLAQAALEAGLSGLAFYAGIPGAVGGALRMNAGAHGGETAQRLVEARALTRSGEVVTLSNEAMGYSYRHCSAPEGLIFTAAIFDGIPQDREAIRANIAAVYAHREAAQPIRARTGGSTFKNPEGFSAWKLIDAAGCRGLTIGAAQISEMHCNFMLNTSETAEGCSGHDMELLGETVRARVYETSGIRLEWEIRRLGAFAPGREIEPFLGL